MKSKKALIIGTRGSDLAMWQARHLQGLLSSVDCPSELKIIKTKGDRIQDIGFDKMEGKGFFTKEIEDALIAGEIDVAVHSLKDLPTEPVSGLVIAGLSYREDPADILLIRPEAATGNGLLNLKENAIIGTSSVRRKSQIRQLIPGVETRDLRGNVPTRISKLQQGQYDAIILASAGIRRLEYDLGELISFRLNPREFVPAPAQGVVAFQTREDDINSRRIVNKVHDRAVSKCSNIERSVLRMLDGGCQTPLGVYCERDERGHYHVYSAYAPRIGEAVKYVSYSQSSSIMLAEKIIEKLKK